MLFGLMRNGTVFMILDNQLPLRGSGKLMEHKLYRKLDYEKLKDVLVLRSKL